MTSPGISREESPASDRADWIRAIAADLAATGLAASTNGNNVTGLDVTATAAHPGRSPAELMLDEDGYAEVRWFTSTSARPAEVTAGIIRVLAAVTAAPGGLAPGKAQR